MKTEMTTLQERIQNAYSQELHSLTPKADREFAQSGVYAELEKIALKHQEYFEKAQSPLNRAARAAKNEGVHIGIATAVGGLLGLLEGLARRDIINGVKRGLKYGAAFGVSCRAIRFTANNVGPMVYDRWNQEIGDLFAPDSTFVRDPQEFLSQYNAIKSQIAKDPVQLGRFYTLFGIENKEGSRKNYDFDELDVKAYGLGYALMSLVVNNILRSDYLDPEQATGLGVVTGFAKMAAQGKLGRQANTHAQESVSNVTAGMDDYTRRQLIGGLIHRWYGIPLTREEPQEPFRRRAYRSPFWGPQGF